MKMIMICVAALLNVSPQPIPSVVEVERHGHWGRYLWQTETVEVHPGSPDAVLAHEFAHYLQHRHGMIELSVAGIPIWDRDLEWQARRAMHYCS